MKRILKTLWDNHKKRQLKNQEHEEVSAFNVTEKGGVLYIIAGFRAIKAIDENTTAREIIELLNECRNAQLNFKKVKINE